MLIDCDTCRMRDIACGDCVISLLLGAPQDSADLDSDEAVALGVLAAGGLAPPLRLVPVNRSHLTDIRWQRAHPRAGTDPPVDMASNRPSAGPHGVSPPAVSGI